MLFRQLSHLLLFALALLAPPGEAQTRSRIVLPATDSERTTLAGSRRPWAREEFARGGVDPDLPMRRMLLMLDAGADVEAAKRDFIERLHTPGSPEFHQWLTPEEYAQRFGAAPEDIQKVRAWLEAQGFRGISVERGGWTIEFSGTARQVEAAFGAGMQRYSIAGHDHVANSREISVPSALAPAVKGVVSLDDFFSHPFARPRGVPGAATAGPQALMNGRQYLGPADFAAIYNLQPLYSSNFNGAGLTIAIVGRTNYIPADYSSYRSIFGLPPNTPNVILSGLDPGLVVNDGSLDEVTADLEWAGAVAPGAAIDLVTAASTATTDGIVLAELYAVNLNQASVLSLSYGQCEQSDYLQGFTESLWQQAAAQGISVIVSAGDTGAAECDAGDLPNSFATQGLSVNSDASTPYDTAVGGTQFNEAAAGGAGAFWNAANGAFYATAKGYIPEMVWNESCNGNLAGSACPGNTTLAAGAGGPSILYPKPSWQSLAIPGMPADGRRDLPDVSLSAAAHDGYLGCENLSCANASSPDLIPINGTSLAAPAFAGIMAVIDQKLGGRQGLANYTLYSVAAQESFPNCNSGGRTNPAAAPSAACPFNDITTGNNSVPGQAGYSAGLGYDLASGLGSVNASVLANAWSALALRPTVVTLSSSMGASLNIVHGATNYTLNITVSPRTGVGTPTGTVAIETSSGVGVGLIDLQNSNNTFFILPGGTYNLVARYAGDNVFAPSVSNPLPVNVTREPSIVKVGLASLPPENTFIGTPLPVNLAVTYGSPVAAYLSVSGWSGAGYPTGSVTLYITDSQNNQTTEVIPLNSAGQAQANLCFSPGAQCLGAGVYQFWASYSGDPSFNPAAANGGATLTVTKATPLINWPAPSTILAGSALSATQLNATANLFEGAGPSFVSVPGTFTYTPPLGTMLTPGFHNLFVQFTPADTADFYPAFSEVNINVITGLAFYPVTPCRVVDTRAVNGLLGGPIMSGGSVRNFVVPSGACGIPANALAYSLNVTVVPAAHLSYLTAWPTGFAQPYVSTLNSYNGAVIANAAIVPAGANGSISVFVSDATHVILDIDGYFSPPGSAGALAYYPLAPCRIADTRNATPLGGGGSRVFAVPASGCNVPAQAQAYSLNMTAVPSGPLSYLTVWPAGQSQPFVSTLNAQQGQVVANAAIVPAGTSGAIDVYVSDPSNVVIDIDGYFAPPGGAGALYFYPATPCRVADTRLGASPLGGPPLSAGSTRTFPIPSSACGLPSTAQAYSLNMTVAPPASMLYLSTWPAGQNQPLVSTLNDVQGQVVANAAIVPAGATGAISVYVTDMTNLIIDVNGYFGQ